jgi:hypothetical protein
MIDISLYVILPYFNILDVFFFPCATSLSYVTFSSILVKNGIIDIFLLILQRCVGLPMGLYRLSL